MTPRTGILTLALLLLAATPARAAEFDVTAFELTPSSTAAGAHADVTIATSFAPYDMAAPPARPRNAVFHLPPGLAGDPFATPRCAEAAFRADACPAATKVGTVEARATAVPVVGLPGLPETATGDLYNLDPAGSEPARLGAVIRSTAGKLFVPTTIHARSSDGGLDSVVTDLPTELGGIQLWTERMAFTLHGRPGGGRPFMRNPTACKPATARPHAPSDALEGSGPRQPQAGPRAQPEAPQAARAHTRRRRPAPTGHAEGTAAPALSGSIDSAARCARRHSRPTKRSSSS